jgi:hypothetical protein
MTSSPAEAPALKRRKPRGPWGMFLKGFIKHPVMVGSIIPSSVTLIEHMLSRVDWAQCKLFVEYGPGVGTFTPHILKRLAPDATYLAIDLNPEFIDYLAETVTDNRFRAVLGSAADVEQIVRDSGFEKADYVLSGLPFLHAARRRWPGDCSGHSPRSEQRRGVPRLPVPRPRPRLHGPAFHAHRQWLRMVERARPASCSGAGRISG